ncbi:MAG: EamA family transporter [Rhizobiaceae bacterium]|nr:EamA family transporter [Rhizobiaceae bacterium]
MGSLLLGLIAALAWGIHDICVRYVTRHTAIFTALFTVLVTGFVFQTIAMVFQGSFEKIPTTAAILAGIAGICFTFASIGLYKAFLIGPVRLVAPIIAAYPIVSVGWSVISGNPVSGLQWIAVFAIIIGVSVVATLADLSENKEQVEKRFSTILWSLFSGFGFAVTFVFGQAASDAGPDMPVILLTRASAIIVLVAVMLVLKAPFKAERNQLPILSCMGLLDATALVCVLSAGGLPNPEFAPVAASMFGMITILIAWVVLKEKMTIAQWGGVILAFAGIGYLAA